MAGVSDSCDVSTKCTTPSEVNNINVCEAFACIKSNGNDNESVVPQLINKECPLILPIISQDEVNSSVKEGNNATNELNENHSPIITNGLISKSNNNCDNYEIDKNESDLFLLVEGEYTENRNGSQNIDDTLDSKTMISLELCGPVTNYEFTTNDENKAVNGKGHCNNNITTTDIDIVDGQTDNSADLNCLTNDVQCNAASNHTNNDLLIILNNNSNDDYSSGDTLAHIDNISEDTTQKVSHNENTELISDDFSAIQDDNVDQSQNDFPEITNSPKKVEIPNNGYDEENVLFNGNEELHACDYVEFTNKESATIVNAEGENYYEQKEQYKDVELDDDTNDVKVRCVIDGTKSAEKTFTLVEEETLNNNVSCDVSNNHKEEVAWPSSPAEKKSVKKKKNTSTESSTTTRVKKTKKNKKYEEKENISVRSSFGKFDQLAKKSIIHVRSGDATKAQQQFSNAETAIDGSSLCKACGKTVFAMEQIKAERHVWHKNCFRCKTCNKQLTVDIYSSHEGELYCKPHFRDLFKPKVVVDDDEPASDKPDLGLEELNSLNVKSRFQVFENSKQEQTVPKSPISVKRSPSILSKLAKFQAKGMDVGVSSDIFNGIDYEGSSTSEEEEDDERENVTKSSVTKEKPIAFNKMDDVKKTWENGQAAKKEERREERKQELHHIRSRLFMGKQGKMKEAYEQAVADSERSSVKRDVEVKSEKARSIKEKFERGQPIVNELSDEEEDAKNNKFRAKDDDMNVFEAGISKKSRSLFQQLDANAVKAQNSHVPPSTAPQQNNNEKAKTREVKRQVSNEVVRASDPVEDVSIQTADLSSKFKFFETYKAPEITRKKFRITPPREGQQKMESPDREINRNPDVVRSNDPIDDESVIKKSQTTAKMLSLFRQMEEAHETIPDGPKPLKQFTPPPAYSGSEDEEDDDEETDDESEDVSERSIGNDDVVRSSYKVEDEFLQQARNAAMAKTLKEKFEHWDADKQSSNNAIDQLDTEQSSLDTTKSLRARFESLRSEQAVEKPRPKVNRFVENSLTGYCETCHKKVYPLEKVEAGGKIFHRACFKCSRCHCVLRMETFTVNNGKLYCVAHFKQLFISKGNYDEGFGGHQHKQKWKVHVTATLPLINGSH